MEINKIYCGENLKILPHFPSNLVDLIYIDPPFCSNKTYSIVFNDGSEQKIFEDAFKGGIYTYITWMKKRIRHLHRILKETGSFYLHCDWHASHYLKVMCDTIFGVDNFRGEIIWHYTGGGRSKKYFSRKHDTIFFYSKSKKWVFNIDDIRVPYKKTSGYAKSGIVSKSGKKYMPNPKGTPIDDVWDIPIINPMSKERFGYPTQKPEKLLERIILASSNEGDLVLDVFCGCGTTLAVAKRLKRNWIGIDVSPTGCKLMAKRLEIPESEVIGLPYTIKGIRSMRPFDYQTWFVRKLGGIPNSKGPDKGIDGRLNDGTPIQIKQRRVGDPVISSFVGAMMKDGKKKGIIGGKSFTKDAIGSTDYFREKLNIDIKLIKDSDLL